MKITPGSIDVTTYFKLIDPATFVPETGLTITDLDATYVRDRAAAVKADLAALAAVDSAHGDNKAIQIDATNAPGLYRVDWPDAAFAAGVARVQLVVNGAAIDPAVLEVELETLQTGDAYARLGAPAGASVSADIAAIEAQTDDIGVAGAGLTGLPQMQSAFVPEIVLPYGVAATFPIFVQNKAGDSSVAGLTWNGADSIGLLFSDTAYAMISTITAHPTASGMYVVSLTANQMQFDRAFFSAFQQPIGTSRPIYLYLSTTGHASAEVPNVAQTGNSYPIVSHADYGLAKLVRATTPANALKVDASGLADVNVVKVGPSGSGTAVAAGAIPNAAAGAANGLPILGANAAGMTYAGQVKIIADVAGEGALHVANNNATGVGVVKFGIQDGEVVAGMTHYGQSITGAIADIVGDLTGTVSGIAGTLQTIDALWAKIQKWLRLALRKDAAVAADHATELAEINANGGSGAGSYASTTDSQEASRDALDVVDGIVDAILVDTGTTIPAMLTASTTITTVSAVSGSTITATIAASLAATISGLTISADWTKVYLTVKAHESLPSADTAALLQIVVTNPAAAATDGVLYVNQAAATVAQRTLGSLTVSQAAGTVAIALASTLTDDYREMSALDYDLKELTTASGTNVLCVGSWNFSYTPTKAVA